MTIDQPPAPRLTIADIARYPRPGVAAPGMAGFTPDSRGVTYLFSAEGSLVRSLWLYDIASGERRVIAGPEGAADQPMSREEELRRERARLRELGVTSYAFARKAERRTLLIPGGPLLRVAIGDRPLTEIPGTEAAEEPTLSPDGRFVSFVRDGELHVVPSAGGEVRRLTSGAEDGLTNGLADFIAQEELDRDEGHWWSPDSSKLAYIRADSRHIPQYPIVHQGKEGVDVEYHRYPFAGAANAKLQLGVIPAAGGETVWMDLRHPETGEEEDLYIARVAWQPDGALTAQLLSRDQKRIRLVRFGEQGAPFALIEEEGDPWINLTHDCRFLESGEFLWASERTGYRHLGLYDANGDAIRGLTFGAWMVTRVVGVDERRRLVYFIGSGDGTLERHIYRVALDGGEVEHVSDEPGWHDATLSRDGDWLLDMHSALDQPPVLDLVPTHGPGRVTLHWQPEITPQALALRPPEFITVTAEDGRPMDAAVYRPDDDPPAGPPPCIVCVYGGPHAQSVANSWGLTVDLRAQYLAQQGYLVIKLDNRGSAGRGLRFEAPLDRRMGTIEVEDQLAAVRQLIRGGQVDGDRVGVYGWSYGGYMTVMCMLRHPDVFKVGVAGAPVADWDGYDTGYTERYMGTPQNNAEGYREGSLLTHVDRLEGKLLLVHGGVDENVHFRHTARLITALTAAQKPYDLLLFPEERHMPRDAKGLEYQERRLVEYFREHL